MYPPLEEQNQIAAFLDKETTKTDTFIDKSRTIDHTASGKAASDHFHMPLP